MIKFKKKIKVPFNYETNKIEWAKHNKVGTGMYDVYGKWWEVGEDFSFDKFWFREVKGKEPELALKEQGKVTEVKD